MQIKELASGLRFPEGPVAMDDGSVLVVEVAGDSLKRVSAQGQVTVAAVLGGGPNGAAMGPDGACYVCNNGGFRWIDDPTHGLRPHGPSATFAGGCIQRVNLATGKFEVLYDKVDGRPLLGPNDIVFDKQGGFWFTDLGKSRDAQRNRDLGSVYYARADGSFIEEVLFPIVSPNGIGLSPDEKTLYVADTESARLWAYDIASPGHIDKRPWPAPHGGRLLAACGDNRLQRFDSLAVDAAGNVNVATLMHGGITVVAPDGSSVRHVAVPDHFTTNICFGGADMRTAFITLSGSGRLVAVPWDQPGLRLNFAA